MTENILFVCTGNTCRSPMAEALARHVLGEQGVDAAVASAGTSAWPGSPASEEVPAVLEEVGVSLGDHVATPLSPELVAHAGLILVMGAHHKASVEAMGGAGKTALVTEFVEGTGAGAPVLDPIGGGLEAYRQARDQLLEAIQALADHLNGDA